MKVEQRHSPDGHDERVIVRDPAQKKRPKKGKPLSERIGPAFDLALAVATLIGLTAAAITGDGPVLIAATICGTLYALGRITQELKLIRLSLDAPPMEEMISVEEAERRRQHDLRLMRLRAAGLLVTAAKHGGYGSEGVGVARAILNDIEDEMCDPGGQRPDL